MKRDMRVLLITGEICDFQGWEIKCVWHHLRHLGYSRSEIGVLSCTYAEPNSTIQQLNNSTLKGMN